jgi:hypothetical protein
MKLETLRNRFYGYELDRTGSDQFSIARSVVSGCKSSASVTREIIYK